MEKAALLAGGVALVAYYVLDDKSTKKGEHNNTPQQLHPGLTRLEPRLHDTQPGLLHLRRANLHVLPPPPPHQPADPIGLVPLAPKRLLPLKTVPPVRKPPVTGYSPCQMVVTGKDLTMQSVYNLPQLTTQQECETTYIPCNYPGAAVCQQRWVPQ